MSIKAEQEIEAEMELSNYAMIEYFQRNSPFSQGTYEVWVWHSIIYVNAVEALAVLRTPALLSAPQLQ